MNSEGKGEYLHPRKPIKEDFIYDAKVKASTELDNLVETGEYIGNFPDGEDGHFHKNNVGGFDKYNVLFSVDGYFFKGILSINLIERGRLFKDITQIKDVTEAIFGSNGKNPTSNGLATSSNNNVSQGNKNSNIKKSTSTDDGIRHSMRAVSAEDYESVIQENEELRAQVGLLERQFEVTKGHEPNMDDVQKMGKKLLKKYKSSYSIENFNHNMQQIIELNDTPFSPYRIPTTFCIFKISIYIIT